MPKKSEGQERWACIAINNLGIILKYERGGNLLSDSHNIFNSLESYFCHVFVRLATLYRPKCILGNH